MKKGFALDDDRLKNLGGGNYFDELLARIRDIRSSEKVFWRKVLEIYATSIDYDPKAENSILFFKQVQKKMHWAAHKHTAAEIIYQRADADRDNMGLTSWAGKEIKRSDVEVAKNYLNETEIDALNKIVTAKMYCFRYFPSICEIFLSSSRACMGCRQGTEKWRCFFLYKTKIFRIFFFRCHGILTEHIEFGNVGLLGDGENLCHIRWLHIALSFQQII